jgi:saccharopine dehydrogenase-like NADP-dependent oxidoreductase
LPNKLFNDLASVLESLLSRVPRIVKTVMIMSKVKKAEEEKKKKVYYEKKEKKAAEVKKK